MQSVGVRMVQREDLIEQLGSMCEQDKHKCSKQREENSWKASPTDARHWCALSE